MPDSGTLSFDKTGTNITLKVVSGPPCLGSFNLWYRTKDTPGVIQLYPEIPKIIHDTLPDEFILPFDFQQIADITLRIVGKYGPLPNHTQVGVRYMFYQNGIELSITPSSFNVISEDVPPPYKEYTLDFNFAPFN